MTVEGSGYGAGTRDLEQLPNVVRVIVGSDARTGGVSLIEANLDDLIPELAPDAAEACFDAGALDVWTDADPDEARSPRRSRSRRSRARTTSAPWPRRCCARRARSACGSRTWTASSSSARASRSRSTGSLSV